MKIYHLVLGLSVLSLALSAQRSALSVAPDGTLGAQREVHVDMPPPAAPTELVAQAIHPRRVSLSWVDNASDESACFVWRSSEGAAPIYVAVLPPNTTAYLDEAATPDTEHEYRIYARNGGGLSPPSNAVVLSTPVNLLPTVSSDFPEEGSVRYGGELRFTLTVTDPEGDRISLQPLNPLPRMIFAPVVEEPSPLVVEVRVPISDLREAMGLRQLLFEARDDTEPELRTVFTQNVRLDGTTTGVGLLVGDVTGDGALDVVALAHQADVGAVNTGAIYVWSGTSAPAGGAPQASLTVPGALADDALGLMNPSPFAQGLHLGDVTGDGILDVVCGAPFADVGGVVDVGAVYVWAGGAGLVGPSSPTATLAVPSAGTGAYLSSADFSGQSILLLDLDGDSVRDVVAACPRADVGGVAEAGALFLWSGGAGLAGSPAPSATLSVPGASAYDRLGRANVLGTRVAELTGDAWLDLLVGASWANVAGVTNAGAMYVFAGGPGLPSVVPPTATLVNPNPHQEQQIVVDELADFTGDGQVDVRGADFFIWKGGATLIGTPAPAVTFDQAGSDFLPSVDVTGDGILDPIKPWRFGDFDGVSTAGAVYLWHGGPGLVGTVPPTAELGLADATSGDEFANAGPYFADVTGDGDVDMVVCATRLTRGGLHEMGGIFVFSSATWTGTLYPVASLELSVPAEDDRLGMEATLHDLTGDGVAEVLAPIWGRGSHDSPVWLGGVLSGDVTPTATLIDPVARLDRARVFADLNGDGVDDLIAHDEQADPGGVVDAGQVSIWYGSDSWSGAQAPDLVLTVAGASADSRLGSHSGPGIMLHDVSGDGLLDLLAPTSRATASGVVGAGAVYLWTGGAGFSAPPIVLSSPAPVPYDLLGLHSFGIGGHGALLVDLDDDSDLELLCGARFADVGGVTDTGALYVWEAPFASGASVPAVLFVPGAVAGDGLGF